MYMGATAARASRADSRSKSVSPRTVPDSPAPTSNPSPTPQPLVCCGVELRPFWADDGRYISVCMRCGKETTHKHMVRYNGAPWIGVDLDGTLARQHSETQDPDKIGEPVEPMMERVRKWIADGQTVKIFTARASVPRQIALVKEWLRAHDLPDLEVTNVKDFKMLELWDDRAVQVGRNSGQPATRQETTAQPAVKIVARRTGGLISKLRMFLTL